MIEVSSSCGVGTLKFDDVMGELLSEEVYTKSSGLVETSGIALSVS